MRVALVVAVLSTTGVLADDPRIALVHGSFGNFRHRDDYDAVTRELGWSLTKFENKDFATLAGRLAEFDWVLGTALYNYQENVHDFSAYREPLQAFMAQGGAVIWTDTNYPTHVDWLTKWGPDWAVALSPCASTATPNEWFDAGHPVHAGTVPVRHLGSSWMHMLPGSGWTVLSRCRDGGATTLFRTHGRGFMLLTARWGHGTNVLRNLWATQQLTRLGILPHLPDLQALRYGDNPVAFACRNLTEQPLSAAVTLAVTSPGGEVQKQVLVGTAAPGEQAEAKGSVSLSRRGRWEVALSLEVDRQPTPVSASTVVDVPPLVGVHVTSPSYRGAVMLAAPVDRVVADVILHPLEEDLTGVSFLARLRRGEAVVAETPLKPLPGNRFQVAVPFRGDGAAEGEIEVALVRGAGAEAVATGRVRVPVVPVRTPQVFIDEQLSTRVDGQPFFPITIYHVPLADFGAVKGLGFNSVQAWGTELDQARENLDAAQALGLKVVLEGVTYAANDGNLAALDPTLEAFRSHPALLAWYLTDEPSGDERLEWCRRVYEYLQRKDPDHPVYLTSCSPGEFGRYAWVTDIFAVDPYPIPASVVMVSDWLRLAQEAAQGRKPVWLIPQLHNWSAYGGQPEKGRGPTPEEERNMV
jgi:hypothetical protein